MSRSHHVNLEQVDDAVVAGARGRTVARRAALEEALAAGFADGDRERVSQLRDELAAAGGDA